LYGPPGDPLLGVDVLTGITEGQVRIEGKTQVHNTAQTGFYGFLLELILFRAI
jgi:hypothetical protein